MVQFACRAAHTLVVAGPEPQHDIALHKHAKLNAHPDALHKGPVQGIVVPTLAYDRQYASP